MLLYNISMQCQHEPTDILPDEPHFFDRLALIISAICLAHCLLLPIIVIALPFLSFMAHDVWVHALLISMAAPTSAYALWRNGGWRSPLNVILVSLGLVLLAGAAFLPMFKSFETPISVIGAILVGFVHFRNLHFHFS